MASGAASGPQSFAPFVLRQPVQAIFNKIQYPFMNELTTILNKPLTAYKTSAQVEQDIFRLMAFTEPAPPNDARGQPIVVGNVYTCRGRLERTGKAVKITTANSDTRQVSGHSPTDTSTTPVMMTYSSVQCTPAAVQRTSQRGGQIVVPFPGRPYPARTKSLVTLQKQIEQVNKSVGLPAIDYAIEQNRKRETDQGTLINSVELRKDELVAAERARLAVGMKAIQDMIIKYNTEKSRAEIPDQEFKTAIASMDEILQKAKDRKAELEGLFDQMLQNEQYGSYMGGGARRKRRASRRSSRRSSRKARRNVRRSSTRRS